MYCYGVRQENLELASELTEASRERHAKEDAHHMLRERCSELQVGPDDLIHIIGPIDRQSPPDCLLRRLWCQ